MTDDVIDSWLGQFGRLLSVRGRRRGRILAEVGEHLRDAAADSSPAAAVARFGSPAALAGHFSGPLSRHRPWLRLAILLWLPAAAAATVCSATVYGVGQQALRSGANDPQAQLSEDLSRQLSGGATPSSVVTGPQVDLARSLAVAVSVIDDSGHVLASTALLQGGHPRPPLGSLHAATASGTNVLTWQPAAGVRQAAVITPFHGSRASGTIVVSRSLRLVEQREDHLLQIVGAGWLLALAAAAAVALIVTRWWLPRDPDGTASAQPVLA